MSFHMNENFDFNAVTEPENFGIKYLREEYQDLFERIIKMITLSNKAGSYIQRWSAEYDDYIFVSSDSENSVTITKNDIKMFRKNLKVGKTKRFKYQFKNNGEFYKFLCLKNFRLFSLFHCDNLNWIDTSNITDMSSLFAKTDFNVDISQWDVSNVKDMTLMFYNSEIHSDISKWNVSNVEKMERMLSYSRINCDMSKWNVSNVKDITRQQDLYTEEESDYYVYYNPKLPCFNDDEIKLKNQYKNNTTKNMLNKTKLHENFNFNDVQIDSASSHSDMFIQSMLIDYFGGTKSWIKDGVITVKNGEVYIDKAVDLTIYHADDVDEDGNVTGNAIGYMDYLIKTVGVDKLHFRTCILRDIPKQIKKLRVPNFVTKIKMEHRGSKLISYQLEELIFDGNSKCTNVYSSFRNLFPLLKYVQLPKDMKKLDEFSFRGCKSLQTIILPEKLEYIGAYAFDLCKNIKTIKNLTPDVSLCGGNNTVFDQSIVKNALINTYE